LNRYHVTLMVGQAPAAFDRIRQERAIELPPEAREKLLALDLARHGDGVVWAGKVDDPDGFSLRAAHGCRASDLMPMALDECVRLSGSDLDGVVDLLAACMRFPNAMVLTKRL